MKEKKCSRCGNIKPIDEFYNDKDSKDGKGYRCKACRQILTLSWRKRNPEQVKSTMKKWEDINRKRRNLQKMEEYNQNKDERKQYYKQKNSEYYQNNKEKINENACKWRQNNLDKSRATMRKAMAKIRSTPCGKLNSSMRRGMNFSLKGQKGGKKWLTLVDFTVQELKAHLEKQFTGDMTWENQGSYWHVDHKIPIAVFNFETPEDIDFKRCWALKNLQPLEAIENIKKSAKIGKTFQPSLLLRLSR